MMFSHDFLLNDACRHLRKDCSTMDTGAAIPDDHWQKLGETGLLGYALTATQQRMEEATLALSRANPITAFCWAQHHATVRMLARSQKHSDVLNDLTTRSLSSISYAGLPARGKTLVLEDNKISGTVPFVTNWRIADYHGQWVYDKPRKCALFALISRSTKIREKELDLDYAKNSSTFALTFTQAPLEEENIIFSSLPDKVVDKTTLYRTQAFFLLGIIWNIFDHCNQRINGRSNLIYYQNSVPHTERELFTTLREIYLFLEKMVIKIYRLEGPLSLAPNSNSLLAYRKLLFSYMAVLPSKVKKML